jgi:hypothetical protein
MVLNVGKKLLEIPLAIVLGILGGVPSMLVSPRALAQVTTASLAGSVVDPSGALVPKATVVLTGQATGFTRRTVSNGTGEFSFSAVPTGDYSVTVTAKGFEILTLTGIHLDPQDDRVLRGIKLALGPETEAVTVEATQGAITTDSGEISSLISAEDIKHLAIEGRDVTELLKILPGFTPVTTGNSNSVYDPSQVGVSGAVGNYAGNGTPLYSVALLSDGADITDPGNFGATIQTVNYDQVAEVKVQSASMTADSAHGPIIINAVGSSGGNKFHGSLYTYARTSQLDSEDWYAKYTSQPKPADREVYPGFTFGGPVLIPGTKFNEARKLTFWVGAEQYAQRDVYAYGSAAAATITALVPTAGMRAGDFSQAQMMSYLGQLYGAPTTTNGFQVQNCSPNYNNICEVPQTGTDGTPIANGNISAFMDPGAKVLLNLYPLPDPNLVPTLSSPYNYIRTNLVNNDLWQARGRIDYAPGDKTKIFAVYSTEKGVYSVPSIPYYQPTAVMGETNTPGGMIDPIHTQLGALNVSTIITPSLTNEFYASAEYFKSNWSDRTGATTTAATGYPYVGLYNNGSKFVPQMSDYGYDGLPIALYQDYGTTGLFINKFVRTAGDNLSKQLRTHTIRVGAFAQWDINNQPGGFYQPTNGQISQYYLPEVFTTVNGQTIHDTAQVGSGSGGNYLADFAEGSVYQFNQNNIGPGANLYFWNIAGYAQDHWRILQNLSIDYGLRIEHITPWTDAHGIGIPVWNPKAYYTDQAGSPLPGFLWHDIDHSIPLSGFSTRWGYIEPRVGFSWDPYKTGKTILRGGFGIYRAHDSYNDAAEGEDNALGVRGLIQNITTLATVNTAKAPSNAGTISESTYYGETAGDDEEPQVKTWDAALVQALPGKMQLQIAYVGSFSNNMLDDGAEGQSVTLDNINALPVGALYSTGQYTPLDYSQVASLSVAQVNAFRPYPTYQDLDIARHRLTSNYNGLQVSLLKQTGHTLFNANYTWSKALGIMGQRNNGRPVNQFNLHDNYGPEDFDRTNVFNASYTVQEGKPFHIPVAKYVLNEWEVSGITNLLSGINMQSVNPNFGLAGTITGGPDPVVGNLTQDYSLAISSQVFLGTPDVSVQPQLLCNPNNGRGNHVYFNSACFGLPTQLGTNGTYRFPYIHGPAYVESDLTATKNISLKEGQSLHLRFAAFNFLNHPIPSFNSNDPAEYTLSYSYNNPNIENPSSPATLTSIPNANAASFGHADLKSGRRVVELSLKYNF